MAIARLESRRKNGGDHHRPPAGTRAFRGSSCLVAVSACRGCHVHFCCARGGAANLRWAFIVTVCATFSSPRWPVVTASVAPTSTSEESDCSRSGSGGTCVAGDSSVLTRQGGRAKEFWAEMKRRGLQLKLRKKTVEDKAFAGQPARNRTAMVLSDDVFYGRAIIKIPRHALISLETTENKKLRRELNKFLFERKVLEKRFNVSGEEPAHLLSLAYPLVAESRVPDSPFREWLDASSGERLFVLELTDRQLRVLKGTSVEGAREEMEYNRDLILHTSNNISFFRKQPMTVQEASWALAVIMRHARVVHPHQDVRETRFPRMYLFPLLELLQVQLHPDPSTAITFQEEITVEEGKREEEMVLQIARRDMPKGEEIFMWPGRLSNSEMVVRHGLVFRENHVGIGRNVSQPPNWSEDPKSKVRMEYDKYNCSSLESFEIRLNPRGYPDRSFVRCYRVSWFLVNGWYSPALGKRLRELNRWPPPEKYGKDDWLAWTQADAEVNAALLGYCRLMRQQLKDTMDNALAEDFRTSKDTADRLLWHMRSEESRSYKACEKLAVNVKR